MMLRRFVPIVALGFFGLGCAGLDSESWLISEKQEKELGAEFHAQLLAEEMPELSGHKEVKDYVRKIGNRIVPHTHRKDLGYTFTVVDTDEINAFAVLGGYVYVTKGLLKAATSGAEVASVIGHELAHINARHGVKRLESYMVISGLTSLLGDFKYKDIVSGALGTTETLVFSKDQENEADDIGADYTLAAGYNAWGLVDFFEYLHTLEPSDGGLEFLSQIGELFSTHPPTKDRISKISNKLTGEGIARDSSAYTWDEAEFNAIKAMLP
ncbi:MAG TPA: M48 family metallopeptidase [Myxococcota bacterium]|nr:M48 family metallopeptidase [Myxococcota bacterium]